MIQAMKSAFFLNVVYEFTTLLVMLNPLSKIPLCIAPTHDLAKLGSIHLRLNQPV